MNTGLTHDANLVIDAHLHCSGQESAAEILSALDAANIDIGVLLAPFLSAGYGLDDAESLRCANAHLGNVVRQHRDRLVGFAVINPLSPNAVEDLERAIVDNGLRGLKMVPAGWYPYEDRIQQVYETAQRLDLPILFHSGIFIDGRSGRFCRPVFFETLRNFPKLRVTLAHLGWPWCDEAIAVGLIDLINGVAHDQCQFRFDISFGAPPVYRYEVLRHAISVLTPNLLQFGSDRFLPCSGESLAEAKRELDVLFEQLELNATERRRIYGGTAAAWLGIH